MHCNIMNQQGTVEGVICGNSGNFGLSDKWCNNPTNDWQSYWSNRNNRESPDCYSVGKVNDS